MVSTRPPTSKSSRPFILLIVSHWNLSYKSPQVSRILLCIPQLFQFPSKVEVHITLFTFFSLCGPHGQQSPQFCKFPFFVDYYNIWSRVGDPFVSQNPRWVFGSHSIGQILAFAYLFEWPNFNFLHNCQRMTFSHPLVSCLWLIVSSLSPLLFSCVLSILALICLVLMALFCAAIRRDSQDYYYYYYYYLT